MSALQIACPSCGSSVPFRSQATLYATCATCRTLLVRKELALEPIGQAGQLQPDGTLLRVGTQGVFAGKNFEVIGRLQVALGDAKAPAGTWNEWCVSFSNGQLGWIGEAQGEYFLSFIQATEGLVPYSKLKVGDSLTVGPTLFVVTNLTVGRAISFEGELPFLTRQGYDVPFADLRSDSSMAATIDYSDDEPTFYLGEWCRFDDLKFSGLRSEDDDAQAFNASSGLVTGFKCASCGAAHEVKASGISQSLICEYCGTGTDLTDPTFSKIYKANKDKASVPAVVPLGSKLTFPEDGPKVEWECLGYLQKTTVVDGVHYTWGEYLLYESKQGYRWLVESQGHWSVVETLSHLPTDVSGQPVGDPLGAPLRLDGLDYKHFQTTRARVSYAAGEFYWKVSVGDSNITVDYISPPCVLSGEITNEEISWSRGRYIEPQALYAAAKLKGDPAIPMGIASNQPNPYVGRVQSHWTSYLVSVLAGACLMAAVGVASSKPVWHQDTDLVYHVYEPERSHIFPMKLEGRTANLKLKVSTSATMENRWAFFQLTLINEDTHLALDCGTTVSYYKDGGSTHGSHSGESLLPSVGAGNYLLRVEPQSGAGETPDPPGVAPKPGETSPILFTYAIDAYRDVPLWGFYLVFCGVLLLPPLWQTYRSGQFETRRWAESDHAPQEESDDDE